MTNTKKQEVFYINKIYEEYKHLDKLLSDEKWCILSKEDGQSSILDKILFDLWKAIKQQIIYSELQSSRLMEDDKINEK